MPRRVYAVKEVDGPHADADGEYWRVRVAGRGQGAGFWDIYRNGAERLAIAEQSYLYHEARALIERAIHTKGDAHP